MPEIHAATQVAPNLRFLPLALDQLDEFTALSALRDPFERLVVSAARVSKCKLFTRDEALSESGLVQTL